MAARSGVGPAMAGYDGPGNGGGAGFDGGPGTTAPAMAAAVVPARGGVRRAGDGGAAAAVGGAGRAGGGPGGSVAVVSIVDGEGEDNGPRRRQCGMPAAAAKDGRETTQPDARDGTFQEATTRSQGTALSKVLFVAFTRRWRPISELVMEVVRAIRAR